jgi:phosphopantothenoylcysteine decarboxylase / phosphopantothenate---cysteine ligase
MTRDSNKPRKVVLGVSGGIAAYKAAEIVRLLTTRGYSVQVVMTASAQKFVGPLTFAALTHRKVITDLFAEAGPEDTLSSAIEHISVAQEADLLLVAPATAGTLAKFAHGLADDFLSTLHLACTCPVVVAPAMNSQMWNHPATQGNLALLKQRGVVVIDPDDGSLACGTVGPGRLADPAHVLAVVEEVLAMPRSVRDLEGETLLITAGPTQEPLDPVRFLSNRSSGRMGYALAAEALARGARVILVSGPVALAPPEGGEVVRVTTAAEMRQAVLEQLQHATIVIGAAAVADYRPSQGHRSKIKKHPGALPLPLELEPTVDILEEVGRLKGRRLLVGFAAETEDLLENAKRKLHAKHCDMLVANPVGEAAQGAGIDSEENQGWLLTAAGDVVELPRGSKREMARRILDQVAVARRAVQTARG